MGMYDNFLDIYLYLKTDEELNRLLYYPPMTSTVLDPLDKKLPDIMRMDVVKRSEIINDRLLKSNKTSDLEKKRLCRLYMYAGDRRTDRNSFLIADQDIVLDIMCHSEYENGDFRTMRITDRLNTIFSNERVTGIGKCQFVGGRTINAP